MSGTGHFQSSFKDSHPKKASIHGPGGSTPSKVEDSSKPLATSSQASLQAATPKVTESVNHTTLSAKIPEANTGALPQEVTLFQEEMNKTIGHLLMTRMSLDACQWKQVSDFKMALCWNGAEATEAIKEAKAHCGATIREAEACCTTLVREVEACHATLIRVVEDDCATTFAEAEASCTTDIRKAESHCHERVHSIPKSHDEDMQHLEMDTIEKEGRDCLSFLAACGVALQACSPEACGVLMGPNQLLMENIPLATLLNIPPGALH